MVLLVLSSLWMAATILLLFYSLFFPNADIKHVVRALEGRETLSKDVEPLVEQVTSSLGQLKRAIPIGAYWGGSAEYKGGESHTTKTIEVYYCAWFEKRSKPTIFVVQRSERDGSWLRFHTYEGAFFGALRMYLLPATFVAFSVYWLCKRDSFFLSPATLSPATGTSGTTVTLRGSGFQSGATVSFGTVQVSSTLVDSNTLQAVVPTLPPGPVRVIIKNPDGHQYSVDDAYILQ